MLNDYDDEVTKIPFSAKAEEAVLGSVIVDPEAIKTISLSPDEFYLSRTRVIWDAMQTLHNQKKPIDGLSLFELLEKRGQLDEMPDMGYIIGLANSSPSSLHVEAYAEVVREKAIRRAVIEDAKRLTTAGFDGKSDINMVISEVITSLVTRTNQKGGAEHIKKYVGEVYDEIDRSYKNPIPFGQVSGLATGLVDIDEAMDGFQVGEEVILSSPPGKGKTLLAFQMVTGMADHAPGAIYELEMGIKTLIYRDMAGRAHVSTKAMRRGQIKDDEWPAIVSAVEAIASKEIYVSDDTRWDVLKLRADLAKLKEQKNIKWFMLDYMDLLKDRYGRDEIERMKWISTQIHDICKDLQLAGLIIQSMTKSGMKDNDGSQANLSGASKVMYDADQIIFMMHDDDEPTIYRLKWGKMRNGNPPDEVLLFRPVGTPRFENMARSPKY
jgi:replicative DNA helicase